MAAAAKKERPKYNPAMLRWARERRGQSIEEVAHRMKQRPERIAAWEQDKEVPTVNQARALAELYHCSFIEFFLKEPLQTAEPNLVPDFRTYRGTDVDANARGLKDVQVWAEAQRENALDLFTELGETPVEFPNHLFVTTDASIDDAARGARDAMEFSIDAQMALSSAERARLPNILRQRLEHIGVLTLKNTALNDLGARGMCIVKFPLPIVVFGNEAPTAQAFTLVHELAHVMLKQSGIIGPLAHPNRTGKSPAEAWCDQFAASFLMPREAIFRLMGSVPQRRAGSIADTQLASVASALRVSPHALLIRLVHLDYVDPKFYWDQKKQQFEKEEAEHKSFGRAPYYGTRFKNSLGDLYTGLVMEAWAAGRITNHNAAQFMGIKNLRHLYDIRENFGVI